MSFLGETILKKKCDQIIILFCFQLGTQTYSRTGSSTVLIHINSKIRNVVTV